MFKIKKRQLWEILFFPFFFIKAYSLFIQTFLSKPQNLLFLILQWSQYPGTVYDIDGLTSVLPYCFLKSKQKLSWLHPLISRSLNLEGHLISMAFCRWTVPSGINPSQGHSGFTIKLHVETVLLNKVSYLLMTLLSFSTPHFVTSFVNLL